jgi:hypothetical protein
MTYMDGDLASTEESNGGIGTILPKGNKSFLGLV